VGTNPESARAEDANRADRRRKGKRVEPCDLYLPGHLVHRLQAKRAATSDDPVRWGRLDTIDHAGVITVEFLDGAERYWTHRPEQIERLAVPGDKVRVSPRWDLLSVHRRFEQLVIVCVADAATPRQPCSVADAAPASIEDLLLRLEERGGFVVPGADVTRFLGDGGDPAA
jgi:hypothetical protein